MHPEVYEKYDSILSKFSVSGRVLEVGATNKRWTLLASKHLSPGVEKIGLNLDGPREFDDIRILRGNANDMKMFKDGYFDCVLCNAVLEHDKYFWKSVSEMRRVLKSGGLLVIGTPSYGNLLFNKVTRYVKGMNILSDFIRNSTICFRVHDAPGDYYRYSEQTFRDVFFEGFDGVVIESFMVPPRTIGYGFKR